MRRFTFLSLILTVLFSFSCTKKTKIDLNKKVLNFATTAKIKGFDPIFANDTYTNAELARVYEGLLEFHYLKRPYTLTPNLAEAMPTVSEDGLTYTFKIKKGVYFQDDAAFPDGKGRELEAQDFVYSLKRLADPKLNGNGWWLFDGRLVGLNEWRDKHKDAAKVNYDEEIEGLKAIDKHTLQFKLKSAFPQFLYSLAMGFSFAVPREVVEKYGDEFLNHPVGTGPFVLTDYKPNAKKLVYVKNPTFRKKLYPAEGDENYKKKGYLADAGKPLPLVDEINVHIMTEENTRWLNFKKGNIDYLVPPKDNFSSAITPNKDLSKSFVKKGVQLQIQPSLDVTYTAFNHHYKLFRDNPKLRQAMSLAYDGDTANERFYNGTALVAQSAVPPGVSGHINGFKNPYRSYDVEKAKKLLAEAGFPGGKGLPEIEYDATGTTTSRQMADFFKTSMAKIGINIKVNTHPFPELQKRIKTKKSMLYGIGWLADYPDAENFLQLLYGPNGAPGSNGSNYNNSEFNKLFEQARVMQDGPIRTALYEKLYRMAAENVPWIFGMHRQDYVLYHGWLKNYIRSDFDAGMAQYLNVDMKEKQTLLNKNF